MKRILVLIILLSVSIPAMDADSSVEIIDRDSRGMVVEVITPPYEKSYTSDDRTGNIAVIRIPGFQQLRINGEPILPYSRHLFSVGSVSDVNLEILETDTEVIEGIKPLFFKSGLDLDDREWNAIKSEWAGNGEFVFLKQTGQYRKNPLALVEIRPVLYREAGEEMVVASRIVFRISYPQAESKRTSSLPDFILGTEEEEIETSGRKAPVYRGDFSFGQSENWMKLEVSEPGIYRISYDDLNNLVDPSGIDPFSIRIFSGGHFPEIENMFQQPVNTAMGGSFDTGYDMSEHAVKLIGMGDGTFDPGDYILFYGVGVRGWADYLSPDAGMEKKYDNIYENNNIYWMSWDGSFQGSGSRMDSYDGSPLAASPDISLDRYTERKHFEEDREYLPVISDDRWVWDYLVSNGSISREKSFYANNIAGSSCRVRTIGFGGRVDGVDDEFSRCYLNDVLVGELSWNGSDSQFYPDTLDVTVPLLREGQNLFKLSKGLSGMKMNIYWYDIFFERYLRPDPVSGDLDFFAPDTSGMVRFTLTGFPVEEVYLFDVTDYYSPVSIEGAVSSADSVQFDYAVDEFSNHLMAVPVSGLKEPVMEYVGTVPSLRDEQNPPSMIVIYHSLFRESAIEYVSHRSAKNSPGVVKAVDIEDIYNNFSGGLKDPMAVRNYLKYLYDNYSEGGEPVIEYVLLMGKGTYDPRDIKGAGKDLIPFYFRYEVEHDDILVRLDDGPDNLVDVAGGRLPFQSRQEAENYMDKLRGYEDSGNIGAWRNKLIFVADDLCKGDRCTEIFHMQEIENISSGAINREHFDKREIYLHEYPKEGSVKPEATRALVSEWSDGGLIVCYFGHGSPSQLADELVLTKSDIFSLAGNNRQPLFLAFSCSVGEQRKIYNTSLGTDVVLAEDRGAIGSIAGVTTSTGAANEDVCAHFMESIFPEGTLESETVGRALMYAKINSPTAYKYILAGDPALKLVTPELRVRHSSVDIDTLMTGMQYAERGSVMVNGSLNTGFNGTAEIIVREAEREFTVSVYSYQFNHEGSVIYRGTSEITGGLFDFQFIVPLRCRVGDNARLRTYIYNNSQDGVGALNDIWINQNPDTPENDGPPRVDMYFNNMADRVKKGSRLFVDVEDENGIAILGKSPQNSILLEFDDSGYPIQVTDYFQYEHNSFTRGGLEYTLNEDFDIGDHSVLLRVFDNLGEMSTDTLNFSIIEEGIHKISDSFNFPNPFRESTNFVFQLTSEARVKISVYNLSGKKIWEERVNGVEGYNSIFWDGTDYANNQVANGTYIYLLDARFEGTLERNEKVKGKVVVLR